MYKFAHAHIGKYSTDTWRERQQLHVSYYNSMHRSMDPLYLTFIGAATNFYPLSGLCILMSNLSSPARMWMILRMDWQWHPIRFSKLMIGFIISTISSTFYRTYIFFFMWNVISWFCILFYELNVAWFLIYSIGSHRIFVMISRIVNIKYIQRTILKVFTLQPINFTLLQTVIQSIPDALFLKSFLSFHFCTLYKCTCRDFKIASDR